MDRTISWQTVAPLIGAHGSPRPAPNEAVDWARVISGIRESALSLYHDRTADFVAALVSAIALIATGPVRVIGVRVVGIRVIEWKRRKEGKAEVVDNNDPVEVVMKSIVSIEVVEPSETGCAVQRCSASHWHSRRRGQHSGTVDWRPSHESAMPHSLHPRRRDRENA